MLVRMRANLRCYHPGPALEPLAALAEWRSADGYSKRSVVLWRYDAARDLLVLPRGLWPLPAQHGPYRVADERLLHPPLPWRWAGPPLDAVQRRVATELRRLGEGLLVAPGGSGKTNIALYVLSRWGQPALWVADTTDLAQQALDRAAAVLRLPDGAIGTAMDGALRPGTHLTVGLRQTLADVRDPRWLRRFGAVVYDEGDRAASDSAWRMLCRYPARYRIGATATPERADKLHPVVGAVVGRPIVRVTMAEAVAAGRFMVPRVRIIQTGLRYRWRGSWPLLQGERAGDSRRNRMIAQHAARLVRRGRNVLLLVQRLDHAADMAGLLRALGIPARALTGAVPPEQRRTLLEAARKGGGLALVATKLLDRGVDLPVMDRVLLCDPYRSAPTVEQQVYRVTRTATEQGKTDAAIIDFWDSGKQFERQQHDRLRLFLELGFRIDGVPAGYHLPRFRLRPGVLGPPVVNGRAVRQACIVEG